MKYAVLVPSNASSASPAAQVTDFFEAGGNVVTENASGVIATPRLSAATGTGGATATSSKTYRVRHDHEPQRRFHDGRNQIFVQAHIPHTTSSDGTSTSITALLQKESISARTITAITVNPYDGANISCETPFAILYYRPGRRRAGRHDRRVRLGVLG